MASLLRLVLAEGTLPGAPAREEISEELAKVKALLQERGLLDATLPDRLVATAADPTYPIAKEVYLFRRADYRAQIAATAEEGRPLDTLPYVRELLENPTAALASVLSSFEGGEESTDDAKAGPVDILGAVAAFKRAGAMPASAPAEAGEEIISQGDVLVLPQAIRQGLSARKERPPLRQRIKQKSSLPQGCRLNHRTAYQRRFALQFSGRGFLRP
jgi:hypothetical protein